MISCPEIGQLVVVRQRPFVVLEIVPSAHLSDGTRVRTVSRVHSLNGRILLIRLAHSEEPLFSSLKELFLALLVVLPLVLLAAGIAGYGLARRAQSPIEQMARRAQEITPEKLHARLPNDDAEDELGGEFVTFNGHKTRYRFLNLQQALDGSTVMTLLPPVDMSLISAGSDSSYWTRPAKK
jgi:hypothetical protein